MPSTCVSKVKCLEKPTDASYNHSGQAKVWLDDIMNLCSLSDFSSAHQYINKILSDFSGPPPHEAFHPSTDDQVIRIILQVLQSFVSKNLSVLSEDEKTFIHRLMIFTVPIPAPWEQSLRWNHVMSTCLLDQTSRKYAFVSWLFTAYLPGNLGDTLVEAAKPGKRWKLSICVFWLSQLCIMYGCLVIGSDERV